MAAEHLAKLRASLGVDGGTRRVLATRRGDDRARSTRETPLQLVRHEAAPVDRRRLDAKPKCPDQVGDARPARILEDDRVSRPKVRLSDELDAVERAADDGDVATDPVGGEIRVGELDELVQLGWPAVEHVSRV